MTGHVDQRKVEKKGWWVKKYWKGQRTRKCKGRYKDLCKSGFLGGRSEAHHILPVEAIARSVDQLSSAKRPFVHYVKHVSDWDVNLDANLMGLPTVHSYELHYQDRATLQPSSKSKKLRELVEWFNTRYKKSTRGAYLAEVRAQSPYGYPIHNPVSWGHTVYNDEVEDWLVKNVWRKLEKMAQLHNDDPQNNPDPEQNVPTLLTNRASTLRQNLINRAALTSEDKWARRFNRNDNTWYLPFTMADVNKNPLYG
jgi:hypothetical protein